jgi:ACR3 family arsenite transporter
MWAAAALATVVGVLIEVPVMLAVAKIVNRSRAWYECKPGIPTYAECCPASAIPSEN